MRLHPYLTFNGQCEAAFKFYEQCLGGKIEAMFTHGGTPAAEDVPPEWHNKIMHASLTVGDDVLMGSDAPPGQYEEAKGFCRVASDQGSDGRRTHIQRIGRERDGADAIPENLLVRRFWRGCRSIRHTVDH